MKWARAYGVALLLAPRQLLADTEVVVTGTRTPEQAQRATVKTDVVTREEAERRGATNVADALATQPGLVVNPGSYGFLGGVSALQIQGFDRDRILILEDGERVVGDVGGAIDLSALPTADLARIEVVSGPVSALYGSAALGGVVNVITAPPRTAGPSGLARLEGRSLRGAVAQANAALRGHGPYEPWAGLDLAYQRMDGVVRSPELPDLRIPESSRRMFGGRAGFRLSPEMDVRLRVRAFRDRMDGLETQNAPGLGRYTIDDPAETNRVAAHLVHVTKLVSGASLRLTLGRQWFDNFTAKEYRDSPIFERHDRAHRMQSFEAVATIPSGPRTWVLGARFEAEHFEQALTRASSTAAGVVRTSEPEVVPLTFGIAASYAQLSWKITEALTVMPGARYEHHTRYGDSVAPRFAVAYRPSRALMMRAGVGRGFRAPSPKELGFVFDHSIYGYRVLGSRDLSPETSWGANADATVTAGSLAQVRGSVYGNWVRDLIDLDLGGGSIDRGVASYSYANFGRARTAGAQLDVALTPAPVVRAEASYAYTWTRDDVNERPLAGRPPHAVTTSLRLEPGLRLELYVRARVVTSAFLDGESRAPGYQTVDVRLARALLPKSQIYVGATNVLDIKQEPGRIGDTRPPLGRTFYVGLRAEFPWENDG